MALSLLVDTREPEFFHTAFPNLGVPVTIPDEQGGDFIWDSPLTGSWAVERKEVSDLISSLLSGRLLSQLRNCMATYNHTVLLIEGIYTRMENGEIQIRAKGGSFIHRQFAYALLEDALDELQMMGVLRVHSSSLINTVERIKRLIDISNKTESYLLNRRPTTLEFGTKMDDRLYVLSAFPGIGVKLAQEMLNQFRYLNLILPMFEHRSDFLDDIPGLGPKKIDGVRKVWME